MLSAATRKELVETKDTWYMFGCYRMRITWHNNSDYAQVTMYDYGELRFPMIWSKGMTKAQARGAHELFEAIGYFDMPV